MIIRQLGRQDYTTVWEQMKHFTVTRTETTEDELWLLEHPPVYTQGQAGKSEHILQRTSIPIIQSDRGGQITYHGPGQLIAYILMDINRLNLGVRSLVSKLEQILIAVLANYNIDGHIQCGAPGVYVDNQKIASIGLRVKNGRTYHGIALNVDMDLTPFQNINPCGFKQLNMTQIRNFNSTITLEAVKQRFTQQFLSEFN